MFGPWQAVEWSSRKMIALIHPVFGPPSFWKVPGLPWKFPKRPRKFFGDFSESSLTVELTVPT